MVDFGYVGNAAHTYTTAGTYTVSITGDFPRIYFDGRGDRNKIISIDQWGDIAWSSMESAFEGCVNLGYTATDSPDLSGVASMASMFNSAAAFDGNIGGWDVGPVSDMTSMFADITLSTENYDALLSGWSIIDDDESDLQSTVQFSAGNSKFCNTGAKGVLVNEPNSWVITDGGPATGCSLDTTAFITTWVTSTVTESITIPTHSESTYSYNVDWGDGMVNFGYTGTATHTYTTADTYTVSITGDFPRIYFNNRGDTDKIISIDQWGDIAWSSMESAFEGCANLGYTATDSPDLSGVASMASMFNGAAAFDGNIGGWDVSQVVDMSNMFSFALSFNQNIGDWDVGQVRYMTDMFSSVTLSIENYDVLLSGWSIIDDDESTLRSGVPFHAGNSKYCDQESKNILTGTYLWTITDGGQETDILCGIPYVVMEIPDQSTVVGTDFSYTFPEDTFSNIDADTLTYTAVIETPSTNWLSFFSKNRTFSGIPGFNDIGVTMITVTADDGIDGIATDTFILTVINRVPTVNEGLKDREAFVGVEFSYSIPSDAFSDDDIAFGDTLIYSATISTTTETNWLSFDNADTFSGTPPSINDIGISTIMVTATDFHGGSTSDTFTVTVINRVPAVNAGLASTSVFVGAEFSYEIPETAFSDGDIMYGDTLTYTADINPQDNWFTFSSETRTFTGRPTSTDDIGISTITVTATDLNGGSVNSSFTVTVPNRPPIQIADLTTQVAVVGQRFSYIIPKGAFIDPDDPVDGTLSYSTDETLNWLMFSSATRAFSGNPPSEASTGTHTVLFTVTDPNGGSVNSDFILNVVTVNTPPTLNPAQALENQMTYVNRALDYSIPENAFIDPDGGSLLYSAEGNPNWLSFDTPTLTFSGTPSTVTDIGITMITVTATDLNGGSVSDTFTVTVVNRVPAVNAGFASTIVFVGEDFSYSIPSDAFSDDDIAFGDTLTYTANINPQGNWLTFSSETRTFSGTPSTVTDIGITMITVTATDLNGGSTSDTFTVTVVNRVPAVNAGLASTIVFVGADFSYKIPENAFSDGDIEFGDTLTYTAKINPQDNWFTFASETRTFTGTPSTVTDIGISTITVTATDLNGGSVDSSFTVTVPNRPPRQIADLTTQVAVVGKMFSYKIPENAFSDPDGGLLLYSADKNLNWLMFSSETRTFSGTPSTVTDIGISTVSFTVTDLNGGSVNSDFILNVVTVNTPPTLNQALQDQMTHVNQALDYSIPENAFSDPDGGSLLYSAEDNPNWLSFDTPTLTFSGTPSTVTDIGITMITVTATDLNGGSVSDTFTVTVVNRVPAVNAGFASTIVFVGEDFSYSIPSDAFSDDDIAFGDTLTYTANINPQGNWLTFSSETRTFSGTPSTVTDIGITMITVTATDLNGGSTSDTFTVTVVNRVPAVNAGLASTIVFVGAEFSYEIPENAFSDDDIAFNDTLTYTANINPQGNWLRFSFSSESRTFSSTPTSTNDIGISTITVTATDLNGGSVNSSFTVTVINRVPTVNAGLASTSVFVGAEFSYKIPENAFSDGDIMYGDTLTYTANINPQDNWLTFSSETRTFSGTPSLSDIGISTITVTATDLNGGSVNSSFTVTVPNRPPIQIADLTTQVAVVGQRFSYKIPENAFIDPDDPVNGTLSYSTDETLNWLMFSSETRIFFGIPTSETSTTGINTVLFTVTDLNGGSLNSDFILNVVEFNTTPTLNQALQDQMTHVNQALNYSILENAFSDPDGGSLLYSAEGNPNWLSFDTPTLTFSGTPTDVTDIGITMITVTATDLNGGSTSSSFTVTVPNRPPIQIADLTTQVAVVGQRFSYKIPENAFIDPDDPVDGTLLYSTDETLNWLMFSSATRTFFGIPTSENSTTDINTVPFTVTDLNGGSLNSHFILNIVTVNTPPELNQALQNQRTYVNQILDYPIDEPENAFSDPDGGSLLYSAEGNPNWLTFSSESRTFSGTPPTVTDIGISTITVTATDLNGSSTSDTFTVTVINRVPTIGTGLKDQEAFVGAEFSYSIPSDAFSDDDITFNDTLTYTANINSQGNWLTFSSETRIFTGSPRLIDIGITTITVTATDLNGGSVNSNFTVTVINRVPTVNEGLKDREAFVGEQFSYEIPENAFSDDDITFNDTLTYTANINPQDSWLMFSSESRTFSGTPSLSDIGISTITVTATDLNGGSTSDTFTVTVVNRVPAVNAGFASTIVFVGEDFSYEIPENAFSDDDIAFNDTLTYTANINPQDNWLRFSFSSESRTFSSTPTSTNDIGISTITVTATDLNGGSVNSSFTVTVPNRPPIQIADLTTQVAVVGQMFSYIIPKGAFIDPDDPVDGTLSYSTDENLNWLMFSSATRTFSGTPTSTDPIGISTVPFTVTDPNGGSVNSDFILNVVEFNTTPTLNPAQPLENQMTDVNKRLDYSIPENAFLDPDGGSLLYSVEGNPNWLIFDTPTLTFSGTPTRTDDIGISTIIVTATDLNGGSTSSSFTVTAPNRPPIQIADLTTQVAVVGQRFSYKIPENAFSDPDGGSLSYASTPNEDQTWLNFSTGNRTFSGTPTSETSTTGIHTVLFTVTDPNGGSVNSDFILNVVPVNTPPTLNQALQNQMTYVNQGLDYSILENAFSDPDGGSLLYSAEGNPNWFKFSSETRTFSGTPPSINDIGISTITVTATDLNGGSTSDTFTVTVINRVPTVNEGLKDREIFVGEEFLLFNSTGCFQR